MNEDNNKDVALAFLLFLAVALPALAYMLWSQAFDFDPCNNIFTRIPNKCMEPGLGAVVAGLIAIALGVMIAIGGIRNVVKKVDEKILPTLLAWMGLWMAICGGAYFYVGMWA